jgi:hypothetical protein
MIQAPTVVTWAGMMDASINSVLAWTAMDALPGWKAIAADPACVEAVIGIQRCIPTLHEAAGEAGAGANALPQALSETPNKRLLK